MPEREVELLLDEYVEPVERVLLAVRLVPYDELPAVRVVAEPEAVRVVAEPEAARVVAEAVRVPAPRDTAVFVLP